MAIQAKVTSPATSAARLVAASSAPLRRHEEMTAHRKRAASTAGRTMNAATAG
jgi:hypothetical protein